MAAGGSNRAMKRRSIRSFQCHSQRLGPRARGPQLARARGAPATPPSASSCRAQAWGRHCLNFWLLLVPLPLPLLLRSPLPLPLLSLPASSRSRFSVSTGAALTAHTPEAGRGWEAITPQSPLAKILGWPCTCRLASVSSRPRPSSGSPAAASQPGPQLPVQARVGSSAGTGCCWPRWMAMPELVNQRSARRLAAREPSRSPSPRSPSSGARPRARRAKASSMAAAPPP